jgi:hypothetical protein
LPKTPQYFLFENFCNSSFQICFTPLPIYLREEDRIECAGSNGRLMEACRIPEIINKDL